MHQQSQRTDSYYKKSTTHSGIQAESPVMAMLDDTHSFPKTEMMGYRVLTPVALLAIVYMLSCSGPSGSETLVGNAGPLVAFLAILGFVICYELPFSFLVAELCTAFPDDGGVSIWVQNAFGDLWGFVAGYCMWFGVIVSSSSLPSSIYTQMVDLWGEFTSPVVTFVIKACLAVVVALPTLLGSRMVGQVSIVSFVCVWLPLLVLCFYCLGHATHWSSVLEVRHVNLTVDAATNKLRRNDGDVNVDWKSLTTSLFFRFDGIAMVSVFGGEVSNPAHAYSFAIFAKLALTVVTYLFPLVSVVVYGQPHWSTFVEDSMETTAKTVGAGMHYSTAFSIICGSLGFYVTAMFSQAYLICGMANNRMLPRKLGKRNDQFQSPHYAVLFGVVVVIVLVALGISDTNPVGTALSSFSQLIVIASAIRLRMILPDAVRPTKFPGGTKVMCFLMVIPVCVLFFTIYTSLKTITELAMFVALLGAGFAFGFIFQRISQDSIAEQECDSMHYLDDYM